jgi:hypothetical protein
MTRFTELLAAIAADGGFRVTLTDDWLQGRRVTRVRRIRGG